MSLNRCEFIGNLGRDPDVKVTQSGTKIANLSIGVTDRWKDKDTGERKEKTEWVRAVLFAGMADIAEQYLSKGDEVYLAGKMETRKWTDQQGNDRYMTEVVVRYPKGELQMRGSSKREDRPDINDAAQQGPLDDELAF